MQELSYLIATYSQYRHNRDSETYIPKCVDLLPFLAVSWNIYNIIFCIIS